MVEHAAAAIECLFDVSPSTARILAEPGALVAGVNGTRPAPHWLTSKVSFPWRHETLREACEALVARELAPADLLDPGALRRWQCESCARKADPDWWMGCELCGREGGAPLPMTHAALLAVAALGREAWEACEDCARMAAFGAPRRAAVAWRPMTREEFNERVEALSRWWRDHNDLTPLAERRAMTLPEASFLYFRPLAARETPPWWMKDANRREAWPALHGLARRGVALADQTGSFRDLTPVMVLAVELPPWGRARDRRPKLTGGA